VSRLNCYPQPNKAKSRVILEAFAQGCGGEIRDSFEPGPSAFFGVVGIEHMLNLCLAEKREFYYGDNAFFDVCRTKYYRFSKNEIQLSRLGKPDFDRLKRLGIKPSPWKKGKNIIVVEQSPHFLNLVGIPGWLTLILSAIKQHSDRPVIVRRWSRDKQKAVSTLRADLQNAHCLITHMSAGANESLLSGVPVFVSGPCAATPMSSGDLSNIENPKYPDREEWAAGLANHQWTLDEMKSGLAWKALNG
jgi:hypothetical protein